MTASTAQTPIGSGFGAASTAREVVAGLDLRDRVAIVTGGHAGMGLEITKALAGAGATVVVPARDHARAAVALSGIAHVEVESLDLMDAPSVAAFAERFDRPGRPLHLLVANAGIMAAPLARDARGFESQFVTNHLGHFELACALWPALRRAGGARVVSVSSRGHRRADIDFDDPNFARRPYDPWIAYGQSKTANALFAVALDRRGAAHDVRAFAVHPGGVVTDLARHMSAAELHAAGAIDEQGRPVIDPARNMKTPAQGAATAAWCATSPLLAGRGGVYCEDCDVARVEPVGSAALLGVRPWAIDPVAAERLWDLSETLAGCRLE